MSINVTKSTLPPFEMYIEEIRSIWDSHWLTNNGEKVILLENELSKLFSVPYVALFSNGHTALEAVLRSMNLKGEVITTPFTFISTTHAIKRCNLTPVFGDVREDNGTLDATKVEKLITDKTCAILPVHVYGNLCDVEAFDKLSKKYNIPVIYDAAHAFNVTLNKHSVATMGMASMFSFHATKVFNTIEGGAIATNSKELYNALTLERNFGITGPETVVSIGGNAKMNEFQAAMGLCNLKSLDDNIKERKEICKQYTDLLSGCDLLTLPTYEKNINANYAYYPIRFKNGIKARDFAFNSLGNSNINTRKYFYPLSSDFDCYSKEAENSNTPIAKVWANSVLTLPLYTGLSKEEVTLICNTLLTRGLL